MDRRIIIINCNVFYNVSSVNPLASFTILYVFRNIFKKEYFFILLAIKNVSEIDIAEEGQ